MKKLLMATAVAAALALNLGVVPDAVADTIWSEDLPDGGSVVNVFDDDGNWKSSHYYDKDHKHVLSVYADSTPGAGDDGGGGGAPTDTDVAIQLLKQHGGTLIHETDPLKTPTGLALVESGKTGLIVPVHNPADALYNDFNGHGGGGGGIDLNGGSIAEQIKQNGQSGQGDDDDDDDDGQSSNPGTEDDDYLFGSPDLVNPLPVQKPHNVTFQIRPITIMTTRR